MSDTTPEPAPKPGAEGEGQNPPADAAEPQAADGAEGAPAEAVAAESGAVPAAAEPVVAVPVPATADSEPTSAEPQDTDPDTETPPSGPVSARGHVNRPAEAEPAAAPVPAAEPASPVPAIEPEPVVATDDEVAAAVARSAAPAAEPAAPAAEPVHHIPPAAAAAAYAAAPAGEATWAPEPPAAAPGAPLQQPIAPQPVTPIFLQRPEPPKKKSNRGFGILIALVGTAAFAVLWAAAVVLLALLLTPPGDPIVTFVDYFTGHLAAWAPVVAFFVGMVVLIQILNRSRWWAYILGGLVVAVFVYFAFIGAELIDARYWTRNPDEVQVLLSTVWLNPLAIVAGVVAREMSMWTGAWLAARGRKLKARNAEAQADYEQQLADAQNQAVAAYAQQGY